MRLDTHRSAFFLVNRLCYNGDDRTSGGLNPWIQRRLGQDLRSLYDQLGDEPPEAIRKLVS